MILFFDTETTGLPDFKKPYTDPSAVYYAMNPIKPKEQS